MQTRVVMLELNELSPVLLDRFMASGALPNFKRLFKSSVVRRTDASEAFPYLEPWIQWPTVHFGVSRSEHGAFHLGDGRKYAGAGLAKLLTDAGVRVGVFGSMNLNYSELDGYYLPDPWDGEGNAFPPKLAAFSSFVSRQVQESSRANAGLGLEAGLRFLRFLLGNGLTLRTVTKIIGQLLAEKRNPNVRWKRAILLDDLGYDVFEALNATFEVEFATFFSNTVAHFQHYHWRDMTPEIFAHKLEDESGTHRDAIPSGYRRNDELVGRALRTYRDSTIILATGLSQQPWLETAKCMYRPRDFSALLAFAGISGSTSEPVMAEEFRVVGGDPARNAAALRTIVRDGRPIVRAAVIESGVYAGCEINDGDPGQLETMIEGPGGRVRFGDLFYRLPSMRSGKHHPEGALWIRDGSPHRVVEKPVSLESIAPTILRMFGVAPPPAFQPPLERIAV